MNIIIAGDGEVGFHLAEALVHSNHDITIVDPHEELLKMVESHTDLMTLVGESNSVGVLKQAHVEKADLVISVLHDEKTNILTAILGKKLGAKTTIARVNTLENLSEENQKIYEELGIDLLISPEDIAGHEVIDLLEQPAAIEVYEISEGKFSIFLIRIEKDAPVTGKTLQEVAEYYGPLDFRAVVFHRGDETFLPTGNTVVQPGDLVYVITKPESSEKLMEMGGKETQEINNIMIVGGGRVGRVIAKRMESEMNIKLIERDKEHCLTLTNLLDDTLIIHGDARDINLIEEEGIENMDAFIAVTNNSETNILTCLHAKKFGVKKTIALVENLDYIEISQNMGIDAIVNKKLIAASHIIRYSMSDDITYFKYMSGINAEIAEVVANKGSAVVKKPIKDLKIPEGAIIGGIVRGKETFIALGDLQIQEGDKVVVIALPGVMPGLEKLFTKSVFGI